MANSFCQNKRRQWASDIHRTSHSQSTSDDVHRSCLLPRETVCRLSLTGARYTASSWTGNQYSTKTARNVTLTDPGNKYIHTDKN